MLKFLNKVLLTTAVKLIGRTINLVNNPWPVMDQCRASGKNVLFALWHESTFYCFYFYRNRQAGALVEASDKGDVMAAMLNAHGFDTFKITDDPKNKITVKGTIQFIKYLREGHDGVIAIDGPNGPYHELKPGIFQIADKTNSVIFPVGVWYEKKIIFKSRWDKYQVPIPGSKCVLMIDEPFAIPDLRDESALAEGLKNLKVKIESQTRRAEEVGLGATSTIR